MAYLDKETPRTAADDVRDAARAEERAAVVKYLREYALSDLNELVRSSVLSLSNSINAGQHRK